jgi:hypothetical protein
MEIATKKCTKCGEVKPLTEYDRHAGTKDGYHSNCKPCKHTATEKWRQKNLEKDAATKHDWFMNNKDKVHEYNIKRYGITPDDFDTIIIKQSGRCAICNNPMIGAKNCSIDHDHGTGIVRGLLCNHCNLVLGLCKDNPLLFAAMSKYIVETDSDSYPSGFSG